MVINQRWRRLICRLVCCARSYLYLYLSVQWLLIYFRLSRSGELTDRHRHLHKVKELKTSPWIKKQTFVIDLFVSGWWSVVGGLTVWAARWWRHHQFSFRRVESVWVVSFLCTSIILVHVIHTNLSNLYNWTQVLLACFVLTELFFRDVKVLIAGVEIGSPGQQTSSRGFTWALLSSVKREDSTKSEIQLRVSSQRNNTDSLCCETQKNKVSSSETDDRFSQNTKRERCLFGRDDKQHTARLETGWIMIKRIKFPVLTNLKQQQKYNH